MSDDREKDTIVDAKRTRLGVSAGAPTTRELVGEIVRGCLVQSELGAGAMGTVYRGVHVETGRLVAIKALHPHLVHVARVVERFRREAKLAARLTGHPNVAGVVDFGEAIEDGRHLIVLEYADGEALSEIMTMPLPPERVIALVSQILRGLEHAHGLGLIHRDLKPDNIIVEWMEGVEVARIVDFGIAVLRDPDESIEGGRLTASGQVIGTPLYMAPEQAKCEPYDHRADLFSLGVIVFEMLTGMAPFDGKSIEVVIANTTKDPPAMATRVPGLIVDPLLEAFCRKLMSRKLALRFASARAALVALAEIEENPGAAGPFVGIMDTERAVALISLPTTARIRQT